MTALYLVQWRGVFLVTTGTSVPSAELNECFVKVQSGVQSNFLRNSGNSEEKYKILGKQEASKLNRRYEWTIEVTGS